MKSTRRFRSVLTSLITGVMLATTACGARPDIVDHSFQFNALEDSPGIQILDYRYGDSKQPGARNPEYMIKEGRSHQRTSITGPMKRPDILYVKWRVLSDNKLYEDTVDLRNRLPRDLTDSTVYFVVSGSRLYVYLISNKPRPSNAPPVGPKIYRDRKVITIYPDQPKQ